MVKVVGLVRMVEVVGGVVVVGRVKVVEVVGGVRLFWVV